MTQRAAILAEIRAELYRRPMREFEFTARQYADALGIGATTAQRWLDERVESGEYGTDSNVRGPRGHATTVYWRIEDDINAKTPRLW